MIVTPGPNAPCPCGSGKKFKRCCDGGGGSAPLAVGPHRDDPRRDDPHRAVHALDDRVVTRILEFGRKRLRAGFDPVAEFEDVVHGDPSDLALFVPWVAFHYRIDGTTLVDHFMRRVHLTPEERAWLEAQKSARLSYWEVTGVEAGESISVRDLFTGDERTVIERTASQTVRLWDVMLARVADFRGTSYLCGTRSLVLPPREAAAAVKAVRRVLRVRRKHVPADLLASEEGVIALVSTWESMLHEMTARPAIPKLQNTDGDPIRFTTDTFAVDPDAGDEVERRLRGIAGVEAGSDGLTFTKPGNRVNKEWTNTVLGHLVFDFVGFTIESNSTKRANGLRRMVEKACGGLVLHLNRDSKTVAKARKELRSKAPTEVTSPEAKPLEVLHLLREMKEKHYTAWLDTEIPALGGRTPRDAVRRHRVDVETLLKDIESRESMLPVGERFDVTRLRRELGL